LFLQIFGVHSHWHVLWLSQNKQLLLVFCCDKHSYKYSRIDLMIFFTMSQSSHFDKKKSWGVDLQKMANPTKTRTKHVYQSVDSLQWKPRVTVTVHTQLSQWANILHTTPAIQVSVEWLFPIVKLIFFTLRARIGRNLLSDIVFLKAIQVNSSK
jgi:hypothetical protein